MDPQTKKIFVSYDVVLDEVSSHYTDANVDNNIIDLEHFLVMWHQVKEEAIFLIQGKTLNKERLLRL